MKIKIGKIIGVIAVSPFLLIVLGIAYCEINKAYWDYKVTQWCKKDGGVTVFEKIDITPEEFKNLGGNEYGQIPIPGDSSSIAKNSEYLMRSIVTEINSSNPYVRRMEYIVFRKLDNKDLGKMVTYSRIGGDIPTGISEGSNFGCADLKGIQFDIEKQIFIVKG